MNKLVNCTLIALMFLGLYSCFSNKYEYVGKKKIEGSNDWYFKVFYKDEFEMFRPIQFEITNSNDSVILERRYFDGTDIEVKMEDFHVCIKDSIFYACYKYPRVVAIRRVSDFNDSLLLDSPYLSFNQSKLVEELHKYDTSLYYR